MSSETVAAIFTPVFYLLCMYPVFSLIYLVYVLYATWVGKPVSSNGVEAYVADMIPSTIPVSLPQKKGSKRSAPTLSSYDEKYKLPDTLFED